MFDKATASISQLLGHYNAIAKELGQRELRSFRDKPTALAYVEKIESAQRAKQQSDRAAAGEPEKPPAAPKAAKAPRAQGAARARLLLDQVITPIGDGANPKREGSSRFDAYEILRKHFGKTVQQYVDKGGDRGLLQGAVRDGQVKDNVVG